MSEERDESPKSQDSNLQSQDLTADPIAGNAPTPDSSHLTGLRHDRNTAEISGEMIDVVGEATGEFPRSSSHANEQIESTGRSAFMVGAGILISRIIGVIRQRVF